MFRMTVVLFSYHICHTKSRQMLYEVFSGTKNFISAKQATANNRCAVANFATLILRNDNPYLSEIVAEFTEAIQLLSQKPEPQKVHLFRVIRVPFASLFYRHHRRPKSILLKRSILRFTIWVFPSQLIKQRFAKHPIPFSMDKNNALFALRFVFLHYFTEFI